MILGSICLDSDIVSAIWRLRVELKWKMMLKLS